MSKSIRIAFVLLLMFVLWAFYYQHQQMMNNSPSIQASGLDKCRALSRYKWRELLERSHTEPDLVLNQLKTLSSNTDLFSSQDNAYQYVVLTNIAHHISDDWISTHLENVPVEIKQLDWMPIVLLSEKALRNWHSGEKSKGQALLELALKKAEEGKYWFLMPRLYVWAGATALAENEFLQAQKYLLNGKHLSALRNDKFSQSDSHYNLFKMYFKMGQWQEALHHIQLARRLVEQFPETNHDLLQRYWYNETIVYSELKQLKNAQQAYSKANEHFRLGRLAERHRILDIRGQATIAMMQGDYEKASVLIEQCISASIEVNYIYSLGRCYKKRTIIALSESDYTQALNAVDASIQYFTQHQTSSAILSVLKLKMTIFEAQGDLSSAYSLFKEIYLTEKEQLLNKLRDLTHAQETFELALRLDEVNRENQEHSLELDQQSLYLNYAKWLGVIAIITMAGMYIRTQLMKRENAHLMLRSSVDQLTGLYNRHYYYQQLVKGDAIQREEEYYLALLDIDRFKLINDTYGHLIGDEVLQEFASRIKPCLQSEELFVRWGGEEFLILIKADDRAISRLENMRRTLAQTPFITTRKAISVTASIGVSQPVTPDQLLADERFFLDADDCLYQAKQAGRNQIRVCNA